MVLNRIHHQSLFCLVSSLFFGAHHPQASFETSFRMLGSAIKVRRWNTVAMWPKIKEITLATTKVKNGNIGTGVTFLKWENIWNNGTSKNKMKKQNARQLYLPSLTLICLYLPVGFWNCLISFKFTKEWMHCWISCQGNLSGKIGNHKGTSSIPFCKETCQPLNGSLSSTDLQLIMCPQQG